jgi:hypothetical protein
MLEGSIRDAHCRVLRKLAFIHPMQTVLIVSQLAHLQVCRYHPIPCCTAPCCDCQRYHHQRLHYHFGFERLSLGPEVSSSDRCVTLWYHAYALVSTYHNVFEKHHRFVGWLGLAVCIPIAVFG